MHGGLGGSIISDKLGQESNIGINISYSYHLSLSFADLGIGVGINLINRNIDFGSFKPTQSGDPLLKPVADGEMLFDGNLGVFLKSSDYILGFSVDNLLESKGRDLGTGTQIRFQTDRTFYLQGIYYFNVGSDFIVSPGIMVQSDLIRTQATVSANISLKNKFYGGISYRIGESVGVMAGVKVKDFNISYSYDIPNTSMPGSHEVGLSYCFRIKADHTKTSYKNTRFL
jgi:type IX secretion system PorP/SprF family membrane protein